MLNIASRNSIEKNQFTSKHEQTLVGVRNAAIMVVQSTRKTDKNSYARNSKHGGAGNQLNTTTRKLCNPNPDP